MDGEVRLDVICVAVHLPVAAGLSDDEEANGVALGKEGCEAGREDGNAFRERERQGGNRDPNFGADHQGDVGEASNRDESAGKSVGGTIASPGRTRFAATRRRSCMAAPRVS